MLLNIVFSAEQLVYISHWSDLLESCYQYVPRSSMVRKEGKRRKKKTKARRKKDRGKRKRKRKRRGKEEEPDQSHAKN